MKSLFEASNHSEKEDAGCLLTRLGQPAHLQSQMSVQLYLPAGLAEAVKLNSKSNYLHTFVM